jgi:hypothetical protein
MSGMTFGDLVGGQALDPAWRSVAGASGSITGLVDADGVPVTTAVVAARYDVARWFEESDEALGILEDAGDVVGVTDGMSVVGLLPAGTVRHALEAAAGGQLRGTLGWNAGSWADPELADGRIKKATTLVRLVGICGHVRYSFAPREPFGLCRDTTTPPHPFVPLDDE